METGGGDLIVTFFDHVGHDGDEQAVGSLRFPSYGFSRDVDLGYTAREMAIRIWNVMQALAATGMMPCGRCLAFGREADALPSKSCPKDGWEQDPYIALWMAFDELVESRTVDGRHVDTAPSPYE